ncbi:MAG: hypothetical protein LBB77_09205 [Treponema sp.]|nr:hypothetical protein [Treponema sp.]
MPEYGPSSKVIFSFYRYVMSRLRLYLFTGGKSRRMGEYDTAGSTA